MWSAAVSIAMYNLIEYAPLPEVEYTEITDMAFLKRVVIAASIRFVREFPECEGDEICSDVDTESLEVHVSCGGFGAVYAFDDLV